MSLYLPSIPEEDLHEACKRCKLHRSMKHDIEFEDKVKGIKTSYKKGDFPIACEGIPKNTKDLLKKRMGKHWLKLSPEDQQLLTEQWDIVEWAKANLKDDTGKPWSPRAPLDEYVNKFGFTGDALEYQELMLRCTANKSIDRVGRRSGKTESKVVRMLFLAQTNSNFKILVLAPYQIQAEAIYSNLLKKIDDSDTLRDTRARSVRTPVFEIELKNGSTIKIFTAGSKSSSGAGTVRGQGCHVLFLEEADMLQEMDWVSVTPTILDNKDLNLWIASTPTGKKERYYKACHDPTYREFHFPSMVSPNWSDEAEREMRSQFIGWQYDQEVLALFADLEGGVFQKAYVEKAISTPYKYSDEIFHKDWVYMIGVDWNQVHSTEIIVVGARWVLEEGNKRPTVIFRVVDSISTPRDGHTQTKAVQAVIDANRKWKPEFVYVDRGAGSTNIELLHQFGKESQGRKTPSSKIDARLLKIAKAIDFGSSIDWLDPWTRQETKRPLKPILVENAIRKVEEGWLEMSPFDNILIDQMEHYVIKKISPGNIPLYGPEIDSVGDHKLDALMLSLLAFTLEKDVYKPTTPTFGALAVDIGSEGANNFTAKSLMGKIELPIGKERDKQKNKRSNESRRLDSGYPGETLNRLPAGNVTEHSSVPFSFRHPKHTNPNLLKRGRRKPSGRPNI